MNIYPDILQGMSHSEQVKCYEAAMNILTSNEYCEVLSSGIMEEESDLMGDTVVAAMRKNCGLPVIP